MVEQKKDVRKLSVHELGQFFELSLISYVSDDDIRKSCEKALAYNLAGVYCSTHELPMVKEFLKGSSLFTGASIAFPRGVNAPEVKAFEAERLIKRGAEHIDFVMNYRALLQGKESIVEEEVALIRQAAPDAVLKMIIECCYLTDEQIDFACQVAIANKIDFVKSSTGQQAGPTFAQACRIADHVHKAGLRAKVAGVKAPRPQNAMVYLLAGIDRIGTQQPFEILDGIDEMRTRGVF